VKRVVCFGEALIDFLNTGRVHEGEMSLNSFTQFPGGAPANAAVAVAKLGGEAVFAGQVGDDPFGHCLIDALQLYGVDTSIAAVHPTAKTPLAFVFLDDKGERSFSFRRDGTADLVISKSQVDADWFTGDPIVHFCSNTLTEESIADVTRHVVSQARRQEAIVSFDVNLRHNLWQSGEADGERVTDLVQKSDIVKFARKEIDFLSDGDSESYLARCFASGLTAALITDGAGEVSIHTVDSTARIRPPNVEAVDTTGGGDAFIGAVLFGLSRQAEPLSYLGDVAQLSRLVNFAAHCGAITVTRRGAFPSFPTFDDVESHWET
jgi:fructokinase